VCVIADLQNNFSTPTRISQIPLGHHGHQWVGLRHYVLLLGHPHDYDIKCSKSPLMTFPWYLASHLFSSWFIWLRVLISVHIAMYFNSCSLLITSPLISQLTIMSEIWSAINWYSAKVDYTASLWRCNANSLNSMCRFASGILSSANAINPSETACIGLHLL